MVVRVERIRVECSVVWCTRKKKEIAGGGANKSQLFSQTFKTARVDVEEPGRKKTTEKRKITPHTLSVLTPPKRSLSHSLAPWQSTSSLHCAPGNPLVHLPVFQLVVIPPPFPAQKFHAQSSSRVQLCCDCRLPAGYRHLSVPIPPCMPVSSQRPLRQFDESPHSAPGWPEVQRPVPGVDVMPPKLSLHQPYWHSLFSVQLNPPARLAAGYRHASVSMLPTLAAPVVTSQLPDAQPPLELHADPTALSEHRPFTHA